MLKINSFQKLDEIINHIKETEFNDGDFCLYGNNDHPLEVGVNYFISDYPKVEYDKEIYPKSVINHNLSFIYSGDQFVDVIANASNQNSATSIDDYVKALNYYLENDDFLDL